MQGCGFQLRGTGHEYGSNNINNIYVAATAANRIATEIKSQLAVANIQVKNSTRDANYALHLHNEKFAQTVQSVSADTGKTEEYQIVFSTVISINKVDGEQLVDSQRITVSKDYTFDEEALLGKFSEEEVIREELLKQAASQILRRLLAVAK